MNSGAARLRFRYACVDGICVERVPRQVNLVPFWKPFIVHERRDIAYLVILNVEPCQAGEIGQRHMDVQGEWIDI
jgi:hypothetical protein